MKTTVLVIAVLVASVINSYSQVTETWRKSYTQEVESRIIGSKLDNQGNIIVGSSVSRFGEGANYVIIKFNSNGDTLWRREYHSYTNQHDHLFDTYVDAQGNIYATGLATNYNDPFQTTRTIKYSPSGNLLWIAVDTTNTFMAVNGESKEGYIREDANGDIYVCTNKQAKLYVIKYSSSGNAIWKRHINVPFVLNNRTLPRAFEIHTSGLFIFVQALDVNYADNVLGIKCNFGGDTLWTWTNNFGNTFHEGARAMTLDAQGNAYYVSELLIDYQTSRLAISKYGGWAKLYGDGMQDRRIIPGDIKADNSGNLIMTTSHAYTSGSLQNQKFNAVTIKYNSQGDSVWGRTINGFSNNSTIPYNIKIDNNNYIYITGEYPLGAAVGSRTQYIQKYSPVGDSVWNFNVQNVNYWSMGKVINIDNNGSAIVTSSRFGGIMITKFDNATSVHQISMEVPVSFTLSQNFPNPFNPSTKIKFDITQDSRGGQDVKLIIYNSLGKQVETLVNEKLTSGSYEVNWNASDYTSGVYFYKLVAGSFTETKSMVLLK